MFFDCFKTFPCLKQHSAVGGPGDTWLEYSEGTQDRVRSIALHGNPAPPPVFPAVALPGDSKGWTLHAGQSPGSHFTKHKLCHYQTCQMSLSLDKCHEAGTSRRGTQELGLEKQVLILAKVSDMYVPVKD